MVLQNKIDFCILVTATNCNPNGDPLNGNRPRTSYDGFGEISDVCIKRKIRNRMIDMGKNVFVQSDDKCVDGYFCLKDRAEAVLKEKNKEDNVKKACQTWLDVRTFGQVFAFKKNNDNSENVVSAPVRGPVSIRAGISCSPVDVTSMQIVKSVNNEPGEKKSPDTMGTKHRVNFGLYKIMGSVNVQLAEKTGFSEEDAEILKECLRTLFVNDASSARPDGCMEVVKMYWWKHNCKEGQYSAAKVHNSVQVTLKTEGTAPKCYEDYEVVLTEPEGLAVEEVI